jgi:hypothetical protein
MIKRIHPALVAFFVLVLVCLAGVWILSKTYGAPEGFLVTSDPGAIYIRERIIPLYMVIVGKDLKTTDNKKVNDTLVPLLQELQMINNSPDAWSKKGTKEERARSINNNYIDPLNKAIRDNKVSGVTPLLAFAYPGELRSPLESEIEKGLSGIETACKIEYDACIAAGGRINDCVKDRTECQDRLAKEVKGEDPGCVRQYQLCKAQNGTEQRCTADKQLCQKKADERKDFYNSLTTASNSPNVPQFNSIQIKKEARERTDKICNTEYAECIIKEKQQTCIDRKTGCLEKFNKLLDSIDTGIAASATGITISPQLQDLLKQLEGTAATAGPTVNLGLAQLLGAGSGLGKENSTYTQNRDTLQPHETPFNRSGSYTPIQPDVPDIPLLTPSVRQQIRNDVAGVIRDELRNIGAEGFNSYEIKYNHM